MNNTHNNNESCKMTFKERLRATKPTRWIRFGIVSIVLLLWTIWMGNAWLFLIWFLLFDIYITGYIPLTWWKKSKNKSVRMVMGWVDAILYALILVYFIFAFFGQNYRIPSSSLEKSLLVGDYLWTSKMTYGPRVPQTPLHFPLAQHTLFGDVKSYIDQPQLAYHRLPGLRSVERGDIVVFNYPAGDTVATAIPNPDYYQLCRMLKAEGVDDPKAYIAANPSRFGRVVWRPVDRRENYVKRAIGLPGEWLQIKNDTVLINGSAIAEPDNVQYNYIIPVSTPISTEKWQTIGVRMEDHGAGPLDASMLGYPFYTVPLTREARDIVAKWPEVSGPLRREKEYFNDGYGEMYPLNSNYGWTRPNIGPLWIPKRGSTLHLTLNNLPLYMRPISVYEGNDVKVKDGKIYINGQQTDYYTFKMDYYWMMGDNRDRSADSRYWGFVPEDHVVGTPIFVICSFDEEKGLFDGKIRLNRILRDANPDKKKWSDSKPQ